MSDYTIEETEYEGLTIEIVQDEDMSSVHPRRDYTTATRIAAWHRRSDLGDEGLNYGDLPQFDSEEELGEWLVKEHGALHIKPLYLYEHSGQTISLTPFSCPWDSGQVGFVFLTAETIKETGVPEDHYDTAIEQEVKEYDSWLRGEVYGYVIKNEEGDVLGSCWGFIGDTKYAMEEAMEEAKHHAEDRVKEAEEKAHWAARDTVTV